MLKVSNINVYYDIIYAVKDVSFEVNAGEIVSLIGANGAGKSTILKTLSGLLKSETGSISFLDNEIKNMLPNEIVKLGIVHVPEGRRIFANMTVKENLEVGGYVRSKKEVEEGIEDIFFRFPRLKERHRQLAGTLSGGEQQMLAIGRALMSKPTLLMFDEPSMGLAPLLIAQVFEIIKELNSLGTTILLVEQNAQMALSISNRGYVLENGKIVISDDSKSLLQNDIVKCAYLGS
ncbi:MAG: ABC transporter ATP-binding protein [Clostridiales bacterium]|jgi:branched-chain amino acid transport system ATP-binding protein|nr:ABC transporter ATP-binding protein [Clostridiales bacterium]